MTIVANEQIKLNCIWEGPNSRILNDGWTLVSDIDLIFKNTTSKIRVNVPQNLDASMQYSLPFTFILSSGIESKIPGVKFKETSPNLLKISIEQLQNLAIRVELIYNACSFNCPISLKLPSDFNKDETYTLQLFSNENLSINAFIIQEELLKKIEPFN